MRDLLAAGAEDLPADKQTEPGPLSRQEALELLALSEVIARKSAYGRQLTVRSARAADQQASQRSVYGPPSMDSQQAAAARALAGNPDSEEPA